VLAMVLVRWVMAVELEQVLVWQCQNSCRALVSETES
jgi:hypothetical protein